VVESDRAELSRLTTILRAEGYNVVDVMTFRDAVRSLQSGAPNVLITTVRLGPYNGLHLIARCQVSQPQIISILTHAEEDSWLRDEAVSKEATFLLKPCAEELLTRTVARSLAGGR